MILFVCVSGHLIAIPPRQMLCSIETNQPRIHVYRGINGSEVAKIQLHALPLAHLYVEAVDQLVVTCSDMTMATCTLESPLVSKRYSVRSVWPAPYAQMSLCYESTHNLLYSGSTNGSVYSWRMEKRELVGEFEGHTDIVTDIINLPTLGNIVSSSLDTKTTIWDIYTGSKSLNLIGHEKGVYCLSHSTSMGSPIIVRFLRFSYSYSYILIFF